MDSELLDRRGWWTWLTSDWVEHLMMVFALQLQEDGVEARIPWERGASLADGRCGSRVSYSTYTRIAVCGGNEYEDNSSRPGREARW